MHKLTIFTTILLLLVTSSIRSAVTIPSNAEHVYQIEIIIFSHINKRALQSEQWPWMPKNYSVHSNSLTLKSNSNLFSTLPEKDFILQSEQQRLEKNNKVLLHLAWRQKIAKPRQARPIHIYGGNIYEASGSIIGKVEYEQPPYNTETLWQINGTITPSLIRYINLKFNLLLTEPVAILPDFNHYSNNREGQFAYFHLQQNRRMRSDQLNYIGHPLYGILVKVIPIDKAIR